MAKQFKPKKNPIERMSNALFPPLSEEQLQALREAKNPMVVRTDRNGVGNTEVVGGIVGGAEQIDPSSSGMHSGSPILVPDGATGRMRRAWPGESGTTVAGRYLPQEIPGA